jgi:hypothetical protein
MAAITSDALENRQHSGSERVRVIKGRLLYESAPERMAADLQLLGNLDLGVIAGAQEGARFLQVRLGERLGRPPTRPRRRAALRPALTRWPRISRSNSTFCGSPQNTEFEQDLLRERVRSGIAAARKRGVVFGPVSASRRTVSRPEC